MALEVLCNSLCGPLQKFEEPWSILIIDRHSETCRRGCHCWELQDEPLAFWGRIGTACVNFSTGSSARIWSVFRCVRPRKGSSKRRDRRHSSNDLKVLMTLLSERHFRIFAITLSIFSS